ncbi:MAG: barstar family protein [Caldilineaceae bacterium]|nr:barstar family protein [Caldilineaceae bacterium]
MWQLEKLLSGDPAPGIYRYAGKEHPADLREDLAVFGWELFYLDGRSVRDKQSFLQAAGAAMDLPAYTGKNWDAFEEVIRDLDTEYTEGYVLLFEYPGNFAADAPGDWATAKSILQDACRFWTGEGRPFYVLLRRVDRGMREIPML